MLLLELVMKPMCYVYSGPVHTQDHNLGCSDANLKSTARQTGRLILYYARSGI